MWVQINQIARFATLIALLCATPALADTAPETATNADGRWIPSLAFEGGSAFQKMDSSVQSQCMFGRPADPQTSRPACRDPLALFTDINGNPGVPGPGPLRRAVEDTEWAPTPMVGATLQLASPRFDFVPGGPRVFVAGELLTFWSQPRDIAKEGSPTGLSFPPPPSAGTLQTAIDVSQNGLFGQGSRTRSEVQTLGFGARAGVAFPFHFRNRRLWLKPSVGWMQYEVEVEGIVEAGLKDDGLLRGGVPNQAPPGGQGDFLQRGPGIRGIRLLGNGSEVFNGIGPGLEIELEAGRVGPIGVSIFLSGQAFKMIGDRSISFSSSLTCDPPTNPCPSGLINGRGSPEVFGNLAPIQGVPNPNPPPFFVPGPEDIIISTGPVPDAGVLYPFPAADDVVPILPFGPDTYTASWDFEVAEWAYRGGVGIRFQWLGR